MARRIAICAGALFGLSIGFVAWREMSPRIETATSSEILALVPRHLREAPPSDPAAEARFMAAYRLIREGGDPTHSRLASLLEAGPWRVPARFLGQNVEWPFDGLSEVLSERIVDAARRGDRRTCAERTDLAIRFALAYDRAGGELLDAEVATNMLPPIAKALEVVVRQKGLTAADRVRLLALIPKDDGKEPVVGAISTEFRTVTLPRLIQSAQGPQRLGLLTRDSFQGDAGTYDPKETTSLFVRFAEADQSAIRTGGGALSQGYKELLSEIRQRLPVAPPADSYPWNTFLYRWSLNHRNNTIGLAWAAESGLWLSAIDLAEARGREWVRIRAALSSRS